MDLTPYTGLTARIDDPIAAAVLKENSTISMSVYPPGSVDHQFFHEMVVLTPATAGYLYTDFTPIEQPYAPNSRPFLEAIARRATSKLKTPFEKAVALMDWVRDLNLHFPKLGPVPFHGGTEEEVCKKGSMMCNEQARVLGMLAQIAGIPSRYVGHMAPIWTYDAPKGGTGTGHGVCELHIDGRWAYFDIRGQYFVKPDGKLAGAWDLIRDPSLVENQAPEVRAHCINPNELNATRRYLQKGSAHIVVNYLAKDHARYSYAWVWDDPDLSRRARDAGKRIRETKHAALFEQAAAKKS